jgi:anthranilate phosphoribosyltransferase
VSATALTRALQALAGGQALDVDQARDAFAEIMADAAPAPLLAAFLTALHLRGESAAALAGAVQAVRAAMTRLEIPARLRPVLDTCGTGGDGACTVNISTAVAIVAAAAGLRVAKHGNRSASGNSGSAEVLAELGVAIEMEPAAAVACLEQVGITFLFAPRYHPALRHAAPVRRMLPFRTLFNLIGPLANPATPDIQILGVPRPELVPLVGQALAGLQAGEPARGFRAAVVCGGGRLDEVDPGAGTCVGWVEGSLPGFTERTWSPADFGLDAVDLAALRVAGPADSAARIRALLRAGPADRPGQRGRRPARRRPGRDPPRGRRARPPGHRLRRRRRRARPLDRCQPGLRLTISSHRSSNT